MNYEKSYQIQEHTVMTGDNGLGSEFLLYLNDLESDIKHFKQLKYQIDCNHYFAHLATVIDLILQDKDAIKNKQCIKVLSRIKEDLLYLQKYYEIIQVNTKKDKE